MLPPADEVRVSEALEALLRRNGDLLSAEGALWQYDASRGVWDLLTREYLSAQTQRFSGAEYVKKAATEKKVAEMGHLRLTGTNVNRAIGLLSDRLHEPAAFEAAPKGIALADGCYLVRNGRLVWCAHAPHHRLRFAQPWTRAELERAEAPLWHAQTLGLVGGDEAAADLLYEWAGLALIGEGTRWQKSIVLQGRGGDGKGVWMKALESVFPPGSVTAIPISECDKGYNPAKLAGKLLCSLGDLPDARLSPRSSALWKSMVAGDRITARHIYGEPFEYVPTAAWIWSCNKLPEPSDLSPGFWRRLLVVLCHPVAPPDGSARHVGFFEDVLKTEACGIVRMLIDGAARALERGQASVPKSVLDATNAWRRDTVTDHPYHDHLVEWLETQLRLNQPVTAERILTAVWGAPRERHGALHKKLGLAMQGVGWVREKIPGPQGRRIWGYVPGPGWGAPPE